MKSLTDVNAILQRASELEDAGSWEEVISLLTQSNRQQENTEIESRLIRARHQAFLARADNAPRGSWPDTVADFFPDVSGIPEIQASELTATAVTSAIQHYGSLLVRGLVSEQDAENIRHAMEVTLETKASLGDEIFKSAKPWYKPYRSETSDTLNIDRVVFKNMDLDVVLTVDSPRTLFRQLEALGRAGVIDTLREYFGESVAISAGKSTIRRTSPDTPTAWHQDGTYLGENIRALNIWTAYSPCGVDAAGLDIVAQPLTDLIQPDGGEYYDQSVSDDTAASFGVGKIVRPVFNVGDAILFNQLSLHRTGVDISMTKTRHAIEMWFFAASTFPENQLPLSV